MMRSYSGFEFARRTKLHLTNRRCVMVPVCLRSETGRNKEMGPQAVIKHQFNARAFGCRIRKPQHPEISTPTKSFSAKANGSMCSPLRSRPVLTRKAFACGLHAQRSPNSTLNSTRLLCSTPLFVGYRPIMRHGAGFRVVNGPRPMTLF